MKIHEKHFTKNPIDEKMKTEHDYTKIPKHYTIDKPYQYPFSTLPQSNITLKYAFHDC